MRADTPQSFPENLTNRDFTVLEQIFEPNKFSDSKNLKYFNSKLVFNSAIVVIVKLISKMSTLKKNVLQNLLTVCNQQYTPQIDKQLI
jgi:hypothetical protein